MIAHRTRRTLFLYRRVSAAALAAGLALLAGCQMPDTLTASRGGNTLAVGFAMPPPKFSDGLYASGFNTPMCMEFSPDGRLFVLEKGGAVKVVSGGATSTFLTLPVDQNTERGLLGIAFDPQWPTQKYVYINYSVNGGNHNRVSRFSVSGSNPDQADPASEIDLIDLSPLTNSAYHNGGALHFGQDGYLYITTGDNRLTTNAQDMGNLLGKILRISKTPSGIAGQATIPNGNPFPNLSGNLRAIWDLGLRNPFTFNVQPGTGRLFINDIGETGYEEIDDATLGGLNFGWPTSEGPTTLAGITPPIGGYVNGYAANGNQYNISDCAIIGSTFYNPPQGAQLFPPEFVGRYFYGDHCSQYIKYIDPAAPASPTTFATSLGGNLIDLDVGPDGALYYLTLNGNVGRIAYAGTDGPAISRQPASQTVSVGQAATLSVEANGGQLSYQWLRWNGSAFADIPGAIAANYAFTPTLADNGSQFRVRVTNPFGSVTSATATITVTANQPPAPGITSPAHTGAPLWTAGDVINYAGSATDPEDGIVPAANLTWWGVLVHGSHTHPAFGPVAGVTSGSFRIPTANETSDNVAYRIYLQAVDSKGLAKIDSVDIQPQKVTLTINTVPAGMTINLDGQPKTTPISFLAVAGVIRNLEAASQTFNGQSYNFASWSDGGAANHNISTPGTNKTYTATFATGGGAITLPGRIQAEDYRPGGEGVGYHDLSAGNAGGQYRADNVDIEATTDAGGGYNVGWIDANEWLAYNVNVAAAGTYTLSARVASAVAGTKTFSVSIDGGSPINFSFADASGWQAWNNIVAMGVNLTAGAHVLRVNFTSGNMNLNYLDVSAAGSANILANGDFSNGLASWNTYFAAPAAGSIANENGSARAIIANPGVNEYDIQLWQGAPLTASRGYTLDFDVKGEATPKNFKIVVEHNGSPWTKYVELAKTVTAAANAYQHYTVAWTQGVDDAGGRVLFDFGAQNESDLWVDNVVMK